MDHHGALVGITPKSLLEQQPSLHPPASLNQQPPLNLTSLSGFTIFIWAPSLGQGISAVRADNTAILNSWADDAVLEDADDVFGLNGDTLADAANARSESLIPSKRLASHIVSEVEEVNVTTPDIKTRGLDARNVSPALPVPHERIFENAYGTNGNVEQGSTGTVQVAINHSEAKSDSIEGLLEKGSEADVGLPTDSQPAPIEEKLIKDHILTFANVLELAMPRFLHLDAKNRDEYGRTPISKLVLNVDASIKY
ncbi:MAG: hypothetical protein J3R72DRAFT_528151 [Linnemannia gamsii]|nr:MAG: hypothetical protein J3R72DRAFT_528151 [Linnemannia gamsii]